MTDRIRLTDRAVVSVIGTDAETFLNGLLTNSTLGMAPGDARYGALLTPQGKIICDMIYQRTSDGFLIDAAEQGDATLIKRLNMFKLRADVTIEKRDDMGVFAFDDQGISDPRSPAMPSWRIDEVHKLDQSSDHTWREARIAAGIAQQGHDFSENEVFPADINMDLTGGVDYKKGCFIGQEVVSRMKRRGVARRRTVVLSIPTGAPHVGTPVMAGETPIGEVTSFDDTLAMARIRIDRLEKARSNDQIELTTADRPAKLIEENWLTTELENLKKSD